MKRPQGPLVRRMVSETLAGTGKATIVVRRHRPSGGVATTVLDEPDAKALAGVAELAAESGGLASGRSPWGRPAWPSVGSIDRWARPSAGGSSRPRPRSWRRCGPRAGPRGRAARGVRRCGRKLLTVEVLSPEAAMLRPDLAPRLAEAVVAAFAVARGESAGPMAECFGCRAVWRPDLVPGAVLRRPSRPRPGRGPCCCRSCAGRAPGCPRPGCGGWCSPACAATCCPTARRSWCRPRPGRPEPCSCERAGGPRRV